MSFLAGSGPVTNAAEFLAMRGMSGLGAVAPYAPYRQGTRQWWIWYATQYLPRYYSSQQIQQYVQGSPYYVQFGSPFGYGSGLTPYQYPYQVPQYQYPTYQSQYGYNPYTYNAYPYSAQQYQYPYNQYGYFDPYSQAQYTQYQGEQGAINCQSQGGFWDYVQQACNAVSGQPYGASGSPPNVVGLPEAQAIQMLNAAGYNVWELNVDGQSRGVPPGYSANRVSISANGGTVTAQAVG